MIRTGQFQDLIILRHTRDGLILGDDDPAEVLLPNAERPADDTEGRKVRVFVYRDEWGSRQATTRTPRAQVGEFARLKVLAIRGAGARMDLGLGAGLLVPHAEQKKPLEEGRWYVVRVARNERTDELYGSTRIEHFLDNSTLTVKKGDAARLLVFARSELGLSVIVNDLHQGLIHANEVFRPVGIGDRLTGYVKQVRDDNKLDIVLQAIGYRKYNDVNAAMLAKRLRSSSGYLPFNDKSSAEEIHAEFGISKKAFKQALGALYKERLVRIEEEGIVWIGDRPNAA